VQAGLLLLFLILICAGCGRDAVVRDGNAVELEVQKANSWVEGESISDRLLIYSNSYSEASCFPSPGGTDSLVWSITNYALLKRIALIPNIDLRIFSNVVSRVLVLAGPKRFFNDMETEANVPLLISEQASVKHVVVDSFYINFRDMPAEEANRVLEEAKKEIEGGTPFQTVFQSYTERFGYDKTLHLPDGKIAKQSLTKIGNLGDFVLPENYNTLFSYRESWMPDAHRELVLISKEGEVRIDVDKDQGGRSVLHYIREVYERKK
jgi:hypothetical protein